MNLNRWLKETFLKVMLWNRVLNKEEISNLVNTIPQENLKLHYEFENGKTNRFI